MIIPGSRYRKLQRTIAMLVERQDLPEGYDVVMHKIEQYVASKKAQRFAVDLLELVLSIMRREVHLTIFSMGSGFALVNQKITVRTLGVDIRQNGDIQLHLYYGPYMTTVQMVEGPLIYRHEIYEGNLQIESKCVLGVKDDTIVMEGNTTINLAEIIR